MSAENQDESGATLAAAILGVHHIESLHPDPSVEQYADAVLAEVKEALVNAMTPPPGGPDDEFWRGAQWAYGRVRDALTPPASPPTSTPEEA